MSAWDAPAEELQEDERTSSPAGRSVPVLAAVLVVAAVVGFLVVVLATREPARNRIAESPLVGRPAPALAGTTLEGERFDLAGQRGQWVLVNFFATWCAPCVQEHDDLVTFDDRHRRIGDGGVVSVVFNDEPTEARSFFEARGGDFPVIVGDEGDIALDFGVAKVPESYLVAPDGTVVAKLIGGVTAEGLEELLARFTGGGG